jgi:cytochrome c peroxidase
MLSPDFHFDKKSQQWIGGQFLDGREQVLKGQAGGPPLNPGEMNMLSRCHDCQQSQNQECDKCYKTGCDCWIKLGRKTTFLRALVFVQ